MSTEQAIDIPQGYKMTELGMLPKEWGIVKLETILKEKDTRVKDLNYKKIPVLSITRYEGLILQSKKFKKRVASVDIQKYKVVEKGQIVYGFPMDEGVIYALKNIEMGAVSPVYEIWKVDSEIAFTHFVDYLLKTPFMISTYKKLSSNTVHRRRIVKKDDFKNIIIPLPPLPEQQAIAHVLQTVQDAKEKIEGVIQAAKELKKSLLKYLFTYGPVLVEDAEKVPLKETEIGFVPEEWEIAQLSDSTIFEIENGIWKGKKPPFINCYVVRNTDFIGNGYLDLSNVAEVQIERRYLEKRMLKMGDIIIERSGGGPKQPVGRVAIFNSNKGNYCFSNFTSRVRIIDPLRVNPLFLNMMLHNIYNLGKTKPLQKRTTGIRNLSFKDYKKLPIPLPSLHIQQRIADILYTVDERIESAENQKQSLDILFKTLLSRLMSGKIRVNRSHRLVNEVEYEKG